MSSPYTDPTTGEWVGEYEYPDPKRPGEVRRMTGWFSTWADAQHFAETGKPRT